MGLRARVGAVVGSDADVSLDARVGARVCAYQTARGGGRVVGALVKARNQPRPNGGAFCVDQRPMSARHPAS